jgi:excinuclease ABC subunit B
MTHNKTLAAQLYQEFRDFFPKNAVSYFVSYYDYYQPEAYIPTTDTYIAKETQINEEIDKLRLAATTNILTRHDTIVVASVSAIYNLGSPKEYGKFAMELATGVRLGRKEILDRLLDLQYARNDYAFKRSTFRVRGEVIEVYPGYEDRITRLTLADERINKIEVVDPLNGSLIEEKSWTMIYPAKHYITDRSSFGNVFAQIEQDLTEQVKELKSKKKELEASRLQKRTEYDIKMIKQIGYVNGIENYSRYFDGRAPGEPPYTLLDYFEEAGKPWLMVIDESHMTIPQIRGMFNGDFSRKKLLVEYGFRLPSAFDNRPLTFDEFRARVDQTLYMSATPDEWELKLSGKDNVVEQLIRPTGVVDPDIEIRKTEGQVDDLIHEISIRVSRKERVLVTTLTKRMAEDLAFYLEDHGIKVHYLHSEIDTLTRQDILDELREGKYDVVVGINLLREGLDLPEVSLVAIMDADKEGFLRSKTSLIQIMGRAARRVDSKVLLYADDVTRSMKGAVEEVERRREKQLAYNKRHGITPKSIEKEIKAKLIKRKEVLDDVIPLMNKEILLPDEREKVIKRLQREMKESASQLDFETAALLRDKIKYLKQNY